MEHIVSACKSAHSFLDFDPPHRVTRFEPPNRVEYEFYYDFIPGNDHLDIVWRK